VDPSNEWFVTGGADSVIKAWRLSSGKCRQNLTGHKEGLRGLAFNEHLLHLYSCSEDHSAKCWDLERNEVIREFFGHKSAVHCISCHPQIDNILFTGGRDHAVKIWDVRDPVAVGTFVGHSDSVLSLTSQGGEPQLVSGGADAFIFFWDLKAGKALTRLTRHKRPVRGLVLHHTDGTLTSCGADSVRKWKLPSGDFIHNIETSPPGASLSPIEPWSCCAVSRRDTLFVGSLNGTACFVDYAAGAAYYSKMVKCKGWTEDRSIGIQCAAFDASGTMLIMGLDNSVIHLWTREDVQI
jgi:pleiotropic regulator 1